MKARDHSGRIFGRLTALSLVGPRNTETIWRFRCLCGTEKEISIASVLRGSVQSCGCLHMERCALGLNPRRHGDACVGKVTRLHSIWRGMLKRCNPANNSFAIQRYAARGLRMAPEWKDYTVFRSWAMANGYADNLSIDRIDNDKGYSPGNCRWADRKTQSRNRSTSRHLTVGAETKTLAGWAEQYGLRSSVISLRLSRGWTPERAITTPVKVIAKSW